LRAAHHERRAAGLRVELSRLRAAAAGRILVPQSRIRPSKAVSIRPPSVDRKPTSENDALPGESGTIE
jgi:hypothetical protein